MCLKLCPLYDGPLLGDKIEAGLKKAGVHQAVKRVRGRKGCVGCGRRKAKANAWERERRAARLEKELMRPPEGDRS
jgi:hypothetical protein